MSVSVSITDTVLEYSFATYTLFVLGFTAMPTGKVCTSIPELDSLEEENEEDALIIPSLLLLSILLMILLLLVKLFDIGEFS